MQFPAFVYRCPGAHQRPGGTYGYHLVNDEDEQAQAVKDGWFVTMPEAIDAHDNPKKDDPVVELPHDDAPPTRAELEQKARELGVKFDGRTTDKKLAALIAEKV